MIGIIDSTLREGAQMAGVYFSLEQRLEIIRRLARVGVEEIELGCAMMSPGMPEFVAAARSLAPNARLALWCRATVADVRLSAASRPDVITIALPVSDIHIIRRLGKMHRWVIELIDTLVEEARLCHVPSIAFGLEDATRADPGFLAAVLRRACRAGVHRVRLADTLGIASPRMMTWLVKSVRKQVAMQIGVHTHNDFGMATANAIAALDAGADWVDATILGIGERAGCARLEEIAGYLALRKQMDRYDTPALVEACNAVARFTNISIAPFHPIVGRQIFATESGIHLDGLAKDPATYEPYPPEKVLGQRRVLIGMKSGVNAVSAKLRQLGMTLGKEQIQQLVAVIREQSANLMRPLTDEEITALAHTLSSEIFETIHQG